MGVCERKADERGALRARILEAARELFVTEGYASVSMRKIARRIGYSATTIYLHFRSKQEIFEALVSEMLGRQVRRMVEIERLGLHPVATLRAWLESYLELAREHPSEYRIAFMVDTDLWPQPEDHIPEGSLEHEIYRRFVSMVRACYGTESRRDENDVLATSQAIWSAVHGLASLRITYPTFPWAERGSLEEKVIDSALSGLPGGARLPTTSAGRSGDS